MRQCRGPRDAGRASGQGFAGAARLGPALLALLAVVTPLRADDEKIEVKVVAVLATAAHEKVDPRLKRLAPELKKKEPAWTGFEVEQQNKQSMKFGETAKFPLVEKVELTVTLKGRDEMGHVVLLIKPPTLGDITYSCCCSKFFPIVTRYETQDKKRLVVAVMAQPCQKKKPDGPCQPKK